VFFVGSYKRICVMVVMEFDNTIRGELHSLIYLQ